MPNPKEGEDKNAYISRFMASAEAKADYPDEKQRVAVAESMWKKHAKAKNSLTVEQLCNSAEAVASVPDAALRARIGQVLFNKGAAPMGAWPKLAVANHLEPGVVFYQNMGPLDEVTKRPKGLMLLLTKEAIDYMRDSFAGKPVVNGKHKDVKPDQLEDGIVVNSYWDGATGKEMVNYFVWDHETKMMVANKTGVSCAYYPIDPDMTPGTWHNVKYDGKITKGEYEHLTVTVDPRYEDSQSRLLNDKGGATKMKNPIKLTLEKEGLLNSVEVEGEASSIDLGEGKKVSLLEMVTKFLGIKPALDVGEALKNDKTEVTLPGGKKTTIGEMKVAIKNAAKEEEKDEDKKKENESDDEYKERMKAKNETEEKEREKEKSKATNTKDATITETLLAAAVDKVLSNRLHDAAQGRGGPGALEYVPPDSAADSFARGRESFGAPAKK